MRALPAALLLIAICGVAVASVDGDDDGYAEDDAMPVDAYENLDPLSFVQEAEGEDTSAEDAALAAAEDAARSMEETEKEPEEKEASHAKPSSEGFDERAHEQQMDDLFGDMRRQQQQEESADRLRRQDQERFRLKSSAGEQDGRLKADGRLDSAAGDDLGESSDGDLGEGAGIGATATAAAAAASPLASPGAELRPGKDEYQSYTSGHVTEEVQVGSSNGLLADAGNGFTKGKKVPKGRLVLFWKQSGLYLHKSESTWAMYSDADKESGGVCLMTAYNKEIRGLKVCHTSDKTGKWASGNVGITGNLMLEGKNTKVDVQRLHLFQTKIGPAGYVLKVGGGGAGTAVSAGAAAKYSWLQATVKRPLLLNPSHGNVGIATETPKDKLHVAGTMAVRNLYVGNTKPVLTPNKFLLKQGTGWEMTDKQFMRVIGNKGIEAQAGAYFSDKVGINFNWKQVKTHTKLRINDGKIAVTRNIGKSLVGVAYFYDDTLGEGRVYARDFTRKKWAPMRWEADAIIFNPNGKDPVAIGTRTPKAKYLLHIEGNNKVDGHIYVAKKMKVGGKAHVGHMHTPRLNVKDQRGKDGSGQQPADGVKEFVIGEWVAKGLSYELKPGGTNLRLGYYKKYCWMQMWPKGRGKVPLVLNGAGNRVGFGTTRPLTNIPGSGSQLLFHVDGNMLVEGNLVVKGEVSGETMDTETLIDVGFDESEQALHQLKPRRPSRSQAHFGESQAHPFALSVSHIGATLTRSLQHHQALLEKHEELLGQHTHRLDTLERSLSALK
jgi:hypothetical protein